MNTKILSVFLASFLLGACASSLGPSTNSALTNCETQSVWLCRGNGNAPIVKIKTKGKKLKVSPSCVDVAKKSTLIFAILPPGEHDEIDVKIVPKYPEKPGHGWLEGDNSHNRNIILIDVPKDVKKDEKYDYGVIVGDRCLDPRVHVEN